MPANSVTPLVSRTSRGTYRSFWKLMHQIAVVAAITHLIFAGLFYWLNATTMLWVNIGSLSLFGAAYISLKMRRNLLAATLMVGEILAHAALAVWSIGWDSGFHYYLLVVVPVIVIAAIKRPSNKFLLTGLVLTLYLGLDSVMRDHPPIHVLPPEALSLLRIFNIAMTFALLFYLSNLYLTLVNKAERRLRMLATTDPLTEILNRRSLLELADYEMTQRKHQHTPLAFVLADIDHFKSINDRHGHAAGDSVLKAVSRILSEAVREQDRVARWGGEEFLIMMPNASLDIASTVAGRLRTLVSAIEVNAGEKTIKISMTFGVSSHRLDESVDSAISRADHALYQGKTQGRNQVVVENQQDERYPASNQRIQNREVTSSL